jgi:hypothetical protein
MRELPDPHLSLRDATDYIFDSDLGRSALNDPAPKNAAILVREVVALIYRLTASCQLPEFTEHGLPHLCSLLDRICRWTVATASGSPVPLITQLSAKEACQLLLAILFHDIGMLSQRPEDMPDADPVWQSRGFRDVPTWVRSTHIPRMRSLLRRAFAGSPLAATLNDTIVQEAMMMAEAHGDWPWQGHFKTLAPRSGALAAILAVCDLLDEDSNRCDITTLLNHRLGTHLNCAHWIRHGLTYERVLVTQDTISVHLVLPPETGAGMAPVFAALRNHFRLALLYRDALRPLGGQGLNVTFNAPTGCPAGEAKELAGWDKVPGFSNEAALVFHLLSTFMPLALLDSRRVKAAELAQATGVTMESVDLDRFYQIRGLSEPRSIDEHVFRALTIKP